MRLLLDTHALVGWLPRLFRVEPRRKREFGSMKGLIEIDDSFFDPLPPEELAAWEGSYRGPEGDDA